MPTSAEPLAALSVRPETPLGPRDLPRRIQITDANLSLVAKGFGELNAVELPTGIYQARVESQERPFEQMVFLTPGESRSLTYPLQSGDKLDSPAPVPGSEAMHESLREPLDLAIRRLSVGPYDARILLMATRPERAEPSINFTGFRVLDSQGSEEAWVEESLHLGESPYRLLSCEVKAGGFVLEGVAENFPPDTRLRQPLWCSPGWATVVFLGVGASGSPDLNTASIYLWHIGNAFAPESSRYGNVAPDSTIAILENQRSTELALHSLVTGRSLLSLKEIDRQLLYQKFGNPMLGILGCHLLLGQPASDRELLPAVLNNLELLVPGHPDVTALRALARQAVVQDPNAEAPKSDWPPMLRAGFHALRDLDWRRTGTIVPGSLFDAVRTRLLSGGVWTRLLGDPVRGAAGVGESPLYWLYGRSGVEKCISGR